MFIVNKENYDEYIEKVKKCKYKAFGIPCNTIMKNKPEIEQFPGKYINYFFWLLLTAPKTSSSEEAECRKYMKMIIKNNLKLIK